MKLEIGSFEGFIGFVFFFETGFHAAMAGLELAK